MQIELPLDQMTLSDKLEVMETLWQSLSREPCHLPSPEWHRDVLLERKKLADDQKLEFLDWDTAFKKLKDELREDKDL
ncbi:MAG: addiction module antitoxin RelB [Candidatus Riflebacteria bacterium HGW-Riflebacteria-1]|jgi:hypothetical protein|nr:MAG: addiction module antitoxin RelB [Candidatus Riflebacteria bacterium HGW-Riflebacteria-1]